MQHKEPGYVQGNVALEARIVLKRNAREDVAARAGIDRLRAPNFRS